MKQPPDTPDSETQQPAALRQQAERALEAAPVAAAHPTALSHATIEKMFHELQVHQIELEAQNEELRRAQEQLAASQARYFDLYDLAPVGYVTVSEAGLILEANLAAAKLLGIARGVLIGQPLTRFILSDHRRLFSQFTSLLFASGTPQAGDLRVLDKGGAPCWVFLSATLAHDEDARPVCRVVLTDITGRRQAEERLRESEALYRSIGESIDYGVWICAPDGRNTYASESFLRMVGITQEQCSNFGWGEALHPDDAERTIAAWQQCVRTGGRWDIEHRFRGADGQWHHVLARGVPVRNDLGEVVCWAGINLDISRLKQAEARLRESEERFRLLVEQTPDGIFVADHGGRYTDVNPAGAEMLGYTREEILGLTFADVLAADEVPRLSSQIAELAGGTITRNEWRFRRKDGSEFWGEVVGRQLPEGGFQGILRDITERKRSEEALRLRAEEALRMSGEEFRSLAEAMPQIVWATRPDGWNVYFNQQWVDYTGMTMEESYGHGWNTPFHPDDKQRAWEAWQRATQNNDAYSLECRLRRADGTYHWWLVRGVPMLGANGEILKWFGTCTDIEEIKQAEAALREANDLLEQRVAERTAALRKSQQLLQDVMDGSPSPISLKDSDGRYLTINTSLEKMLGMAREELKGRTDYDVAPQGVADEWRAHDRQVMETGRAIQIEEAADLPDGHHIFLANKFPLVDANGHIYGVGAISHDITERKIAEDALRESHEELARFNRFMVGRELRMIEPKREINALCVLAGEPPRYQVEDLK